MSVGTMLLFKFVSCTVLALTAFGLCKLLDCFLLPNTADDIQEPYEKCKERRGM